MVKTEAEKQNLSFSWNVQVFVYQNLTFVSEVQGMWLNDPLKNFRNDGL